MMRDHYLQTRYPGESLDAWSLRTNPHAYAQALDMVARINRGDLIDGVNCASCEHPGCSEVIDLSDYDIDGPDRVQPQGIRCADHWACNAHANRESATCNACIASAA